PSGPADVHEAGPVMVFPGQGGQWEGMARSLLDSRGPLSQVFTARLRECERALAPYVDWSLERVLRGEADSPACTGPDAPVDVVQPVLWAVMVSLARVWETMGVRPAAVIGHSQGEIAAACVAGVLSLEGGARRAAQRSQAPTRCAAPSTTASTTDCTAPWWTWTTPPTPGTSNTSATACSSACRGWTRSRAGCRCCPPSPAGRWVRTAPPWTAATGT